MDNKKQTEDFNLEMLDKLYEEYEQLDKLLADIENSMEDTPENGTEEK